MLNVLITGANGQLGCEFRALSSQYPAIHFHFTDVDELNIVDAGAVSAYVSNHAIRVVVNCAAYTNVDKAEDDTELAEAINYHAVSHLAAACKAADATLVHISTDYVFPGLQNYPYTEEVATNALGVYGATKLKGEQAIQESGCSYLIVRTSWLYSTYGNNFVKTMMRLTAERPALKVVFDQVGTPTYARDLAHTLLQIIDEGAFRARQEVYHYSNEGVCSWYDFAKEISVLSGATRCDIQPCHSNEYPSKVTRPFYSVLDKTKIKRDMEIAIPYWRDSLASCISLLLNKN